jgi:large subunit ribosomal protein L23
MSTSMVLRPRVSEKSYALSKQQDTYVFDVPLRANKTEIAQAVSQQFGVKVDTVNTTISKGKQKRTVRKSGRQIMGQRSDVKLAYVRLLKGEHIPVFAAIDEASKQEEKAAEKARKKEGDK